MVRITLELPDDVSRICYERQPEGQAYPSEQVPVTIGQIKSCETLKEISDVRKED